MNELNKPDSKRKKLTKPEAVYTLGVVAQSDSGVYGYKVIKAVNCLFGKSNEEAGDGSAYKRLKEWTNDPPLVTKKLAPLEENPQGPKRTHLYEITDLGRSALAEALEQYELVLGALGELAIRSDTSTPRLSE